MKGLPRLGAVWQTGGFFIDLAAHDALVFSNTAALEQVVLDSSSLPMLTLAPRCTLPHFLASIMAVCSVSSDVPRFLLMDYGSILCGHGNSGEHATIGTTVQSLLLSGGRPLSSSGVCPPH